MTSLTILRLQITDFKRIRAVRISPDENGVITITGRNRQGKSSVFEAIRYAIDGAKNKLPLPVNIESEHDRAQVVAVFGREGVPELEVIKTVTRDGKESLVVKDADGIRVTAPATKLRSLFGYLALNPVRFMEADSKEQVRMLLELVDFDYDAWSKKRDAIFARRAVANSKLKEATTRVKGIPKDPTWETLPDEPVNVSELLSKRDALRDQQEARNSAHAVATSWANQVRSLEAELEAARISHREATAYLDNLPVVDSEARAALEAQVDQVDATNTAIRQRDRYIELTNEVGVADAAARNLTDELRRHDEEKDDVLAAAKLPINGLTFNDDGVFYQGVPLSQTSSAEAMMVSTALAIASNPDSGVILVENASLLDDELLGILKDMAERHDKQLWLEIVNTDDDTAIRIEDGEIA